MFFFTFTSLKHHEKIVWHRVIISRWPSFDRPPHRCYFGPAEILLVKAGSHATGPLLFATPVSLSLSPSHFLPLSFSLRLTHCEKKIKIKKIIVKTEKWWDDASWWDCTGQNAFELENWSDIIPFIHSPSSFVTSDIWIAHKEKAFHNVGRHWKQPRMLKAWHFTGSPFSFFFFPP